MTDKNTVSLTRSSYSIDTLLVNDLSIESIEKALEYKFKQGNEYYQYKAIVLDVSEVSNFANIDYIQLVDCFRAHNLYLIGLSGVTHPEEIEFLNSKNIPLVNSNRYQKAREENLKQNVITQLLELKIPVIVENNKVNINELKIIKRPVRSGEIINATNNSVVIFGNISAGARVIASHHVFVFGNILGAQIYAGNPKSSEDEGFKGAIIYANGKFDPQCIAIAGNYQVAEDMEQDPFISSILGKDRSIVVSLKGTALVYDDLNSFINS